MYHHLWLADQQKHIIANMAGKMPGKSNDGKRKNNESNQHTTNDGRQGKNDRGGRGWQGRGQGGRGGIGSNNSEHLKTIECFNCGGGSSLFYRLLRTKKKWHWEFKHGIQSGFQKSISIFFEAHVDQEVKTHKEER
jgi:hypothetical protein